MHDDEPDPPRKRKTDGPMPVGKDKSRKAAAKRSWKSKQVSKRVRQQSGGMQDRRQRKWNNG